LSARAADAGLLRCEGCALLSPRPAAICPRCETPLEVRRRDSLSRTWALVIAASICYVPANLYPVMVFNQLGKSEGDTILSGVQVMFAMGWYPIGGLIFFASILVPLAKLLTLTGLLLSVQFRSRWRPRERTLLFRIVEYVGRWSMLDMFVVSLMVALVQLGGVASMEPGTGATFFAAVVILTLFAAMSFDPRLIWDRMKEPA
jgi:paraquat-inducible protein A